MLTLTFGAAFWTVTEVVSEPVRVWSSPKYLTTIDLVPTVSNGPTVRVALPSVSGADEVYTPSTYAATEPPGVNPSAPTVTSTVDVPFLTLTEVGFTTAVTVGVALLTTTVT